MKKLIIVLLLAFLTTGCFDYRELNDLVIITAIGLDYKDNEYELTIQTIDTNNKEEQNFYIYQEKGKTIQDAFRKTILKTSKRAYGNHVDLLLISENIPDIGIILDFFYRDEEIRNEFQVAVVDNMDVINFKNELNQINSQYILDTLLNQDKKAGIITRVTFNDLLSSYLNKNKEIILPYINKNDDTIICNKMAIFKDNKLYTYLDDIESKAYKFVMNDINNSVITTTYNDKYYSVEVFENKTKYDFKNNIFYINIKAKSNITEIHADIDITKEENIKLLENNLNAYLKEAIYKLADKYKENNIIPFNIKDYIYKNHYKDYDNINNIDIKVNADINIINKGEGLKVLYD